MPFSRLVLASKSPARAALLRNAGLDFLSEPAGVDEAAVKRRMKAEGAPPEDVATALAEAKALRVAGESAGALVIGADQVLAFEGAILSKPADRKAARRQLLALRGKTHRLVTAVVLASGESVLWRHCETADLAMRDYSDAFLADYLAAMGQSVTRTVGGYELEGLGVQLFERIEGDYFTILGLPLLALLAALREQEMLPR